MLVTIPRWNKPCCRRGPILFRRSRTHEARMNTHIVYAPQLGEGIREVTILSFLKQPGEQVEKDEPLLLVETDKAAMEIESPVAGIVDQFKVQPHDRVRVGLEMLSIRVKKENAETGQGGLAAVSEPPASLQNLVRQRETGFGAGVYRDDHQLPAARTDQQHAPFGKPCHSSPGSNIHRRHEDSEFSRRPIGPRRCKGMPSPP